MVYLFHVPKLYCCRLLEVKCVRVSEYGLPTGNMYGRSLVVARTGKRFYLVFSTE
jgi:hypothetical protein